MFHNFKSRTCAWIDAVTHCRFELDEEKGFIVAEP